MAKRKTKAEKSEDGNLRLRPGGPEQGWIAAGGGGLAATTSPAPWAVAFCVLPVLWIVLAWWPLSRISAHYAIDYNEGFSSYFEQAAVSGPPLYGTPPAFVYANYPSLSFHLIGGLARLTGDANATGRWVSLWAYFLIAVFAAMIVRRLGGSWRCGTYAALCWLTWLAAFYPDRIGFNDPHVLGMAFGIAGLYCFVRTPESNRWLILSAFAFAISLFIKHSLVAFPTAVGIQLLLTSRKRLGIWLAAAGSVSLILLILTFAVDGAYFLNHLMLPRTYSLAASAECLTLYLFFLQVALVTALIWAFHNTASGPHSVLIWGAAIAHVAGGAICTAAGASNNHLFEALLSLVLIVGVALPGVLRLAGGVRFPRTSLAVLLIVPFFLTDIVALPRRILLDQVEEKRRPQRESDFASAVRFLRSQPGQALCESLLLCYEAGKPFIYDAFIVNELVKTGRMEESRVLQLLESRQFGAIQMDFGPGEPLLPASRPRFSEAFVRKLFATYKPVFRTADAVIFVPSQG